VSRGLTRSVHRVPYQELPLTCAHEPLSAMRIRQYAHFIVESETLSPEQITAILLIEPSVSRRGSRSTDPHIPRFNIWNYKARGEGRVDDLVTELVDFFEPLADRLQMLANEGLSIGISVMRSFDDSLGVEEDFSMLTGPSDLPEHLVKLPGQHQLLGLHLDVELMRRLVALNCLLDVDESG
jgi:Domain of unknown function (DUF4279)